MTWRVLRVHGSLSLSLLSCAIFSQSRENSRRWNGTTVQRRRKRKRKKKKKKRIMRMVHGRGMDHVYRTRFVKYQGRAKISATLLDVYKRSSIFRVLSHGSISRIGLYEHYARNGSDVIRAKRSGTLENPFFSKSRSHFFAWLLDNPLPPSPILISYRLLYRL